LSSVDGLTDGVALHSPNDLRPLTELGRRQHGVLNPLKTLISWLGSQFIGPRQAYPGNFRPIVRDFFVAFIVAARPVPSLDRLNSFVKIHLAEVAGFFTQTMEEIIDILRGQVMLPVAAVEHLIPRFAGDATEYLGLYARYKREEAVATWVMSTRILAQLRVGYMQVTSGPAEEMDFLHYMLQVMAVIASYERMFPDMNFQEEAEAPPGGPQGPVIDDNNLIPY
jgi:hypothetical protein